MNNSKHLLVIRLSAMGDVAMTVPVLRAFIEQHPNVKITVLSKPFLKPLFGDLKNVDFFAADVNNKHKGFFGIYKLYKELKLLNIDAVADLHNVLRSIILRSFFRISFKKVAFIDKGRSEKRALTQTKNKVFKQLKTTHQRYADVFRSLGFKLNISNPVFPKKQQLSKELLKITGSKSEKWIGIAPFAQYNSKMYPIDLMEKVIAKLSKNNSIKTLLFGGGKKEIEILEAIATKYNNTINIAGKVKLQQELALISNLDCMLSMDSGNAHFAAMLGINTLTIWGITHPFTGFAPFNQPFENAILPDLNKYPNIPCSIYGNKVCEGYNDVMQSIPPEKVIEKVLKAIA
ncbi:glycosyltransferase family 9 protein [Lutibacter sp. A64]|uniref:glycosyltransferase family 9 protein n=1 Tax=Lutibacter sp. A64 TaxID=2918526 RepID=UPI001F068A73|nr:glycosyltransferase family 9 protein [Lutibacter sp. A64]UMB53202.1 glycosyltransferase family 9 protein [Lutibacter sp. A64]